MDDRDSQMLVCEHCDFQVAHFQCAGFQSMPGEFDEPWYCADCVEEMAQEQREDALKRKRFYKENGIK